MVGTNPSIDTTSSRDADTLETEKDPSIDITSRSTSPGDFTHNSTAHTSEEKTEANREPTADNAPSQENLDQKAPIGDTLVHSTFVNPQFQILQDTSSNRSLSQA